MATKQFPAKVSCNCCGKMLDVTTAQQQALEKEGQAAFHCPDCKHVTFRNREGEVVSRPPRLNVMVSERSYG